MAFTKGERVAFTARGFRLEGTVVRTRKSDGVVVVNAPVMHRTADGTPLVDMREEMYWDVPARALSHLDAR